MEPVDPSHSKCFGATPSTCTTSATHFIRTYKRVPRRSHGHLGSNSPPQRPLGKRDYRHHQLLFYLTLLALSETEWLLAADSGLLCCQQGINNPFLWQSHLSWTWIFPLIVIPSLGWEPLMLMVCLSWFLCSPKTVSSLCSLQIHSIYIYSPSSGIYS